jgi:DNA-binding protein
MRENEIYISRKRINFEKFYYERAYELIYHKKYKEVKICGLGACLNKAIKVALKIQEALPNIKIGEIITSTVTHVDDYYHEEVLYVKLYRN